MTEASVSVRPAGSADVDAIADLYLELNRHHRGMEPDNERFQVPDDAWPSIAQRSLDAEEQHVLVAESEGAVVGFVRYTFVERPWGRSCDVNTLVVSSSARGRGTGRALMAAAEESGAAGGARGIRLDVQIGNDDAAAFYESLGYERFAVRYGKLLGGAEPAD